MSKRASLLITPFSQEGRERNLYLTLQEFESTDGLHWEWHLPSNFGYGNNKAGIFAKTLPDTSMVFCMNQEGSKDLIRIEGVVSRTLPEFPFAPADLQNGLSGALIVIVENDYLQPGNYTWTLNNVSI